MRKTTKMMLTGFCLAIIIGCGFVTVSSAENTKQLQNNQEDHKDQSTNSIPDGIRWLEPYDLPLDWWYWTQNWFLL